MTKRVVLLGLIAAALSALLMGCAGDLVGVGQATTTIERVILGNSTPPGNQIRAQGVSGTVSVPGTVSGSISSGDVDWYHVYGLSSGDKLAVQLAATCNCDVAIDEYINNQWQFVAQDTQRYTGPKAIVADVVSPNDTWIWVRAWQSSGDYTLTVGTQTTVRNYFSVNLLQVIPQYGYEKVGTFTLYQTMDFAGYFISAACAIPAFTETGGVDESCDFVSKINDALSFNPSWFPDEQFDVYCATASNYYVKNIPIACFFFPAGWI